MQLALTAGSPVCACKSLGKTHMDWGSSQQPDPAKHVRAAPLLSQPASQPTGLFHQPQKAQLWGGKIS